MTFLAGLLPVLAGAAGLDPVIALSSTAAAVIAAIIFGDRLAPGQNAGKPPHPLLTRESLLPAAALSGCLAAGYVGPDLVLRQTYGKADILIFILAFGVIAHGIRLSGFFRYAAARTIRICRGGPGRITFGLFLLTSGLTYVTSNDIVTLAMTPVVLEAARQQGIRDARLLLLSQYIAANTLSMGLMIGSPTNLIASLAGGINFVRYAGLMAKPSAIAAAAAALLLLLALKLRPAKTAPPEPAKAPSREEQEFNREMAVWILLFLLTAAGAALVSWQGAALFWVTLPAAGAALWRIRSREGLTGAKGCLSGLPWSIVPFAIAFFSIAGTLAGALPLEQILSQAGQLPAAAGAAAALGGTALLVNRFNDLPAAALLSEQLPENRLLLQAILASLNIGCYVTPTGALAGIIWFHRLRQETRIRTPNRAELTVCGAATFLVTGAALVLLLPLP